VLAGGLARFGVAGDDRLSAKSLAKELILIDGPNAMPLQHQHVIHDLLVMAQKRGATVVYASMPESLEMIAESVLCLRTTQMTAEQRAREEYLDSRYGRKTEVVVSR
jgi:hypothetical protein